MEFINRGIFSILFYLIITLAGIYLFLNLLPIFTIIALAAWGIYKLISVFKSRKEKDMSNESSVDSGVETIVKDEYDTTNVIDVDFIEIK
jgi:uncharacterized membrane protein YuzA (DUF378 family)